MSDPEPRRTDAVTAQIDAPRPAVYRALSDPFALVTWLPPNGMTASCIISTYGLEDASG